MLLIIYNVALRRMARVAGMKGTSTRSGARSKTLENAIMGMQAIAKAPSDLFSQAFHFYMAKKGQKDQSLLARPTAWELTADYFICK